ncbi:MAG: hypothetical protein KAU20_06520, partial [Nanoarchaeota archaeon]|nr:hypothetical protein [Nanoarchaeota archaeon]
RLYTPGVYTLPAYTDPSDGTITLAEGVYVFAKEADGTGPLEKYTIAGANYNLTNNSINYVVATYTAGSPVISASTCRDCINQTTVIPIYTIYRADNELSIIDWDYGAKAMANKLSDRFVRTDRFKTEIGAFVLSEQAVRKVICTGGGLWTGHARNILNAVDSSVDDSAYLWYHLAGVWTRVEITQYNNTQYDDGTNLQTVLPNQYAVNWVFRCADINYDRGYIVLGSSSLSLAQAQQSTVPSDLPGCLETSAFLVGRIIVKKDDNTATQIDSAFTTTFGFSATTEHNNLSNIDGGTTDEYYHMTSTQHTNNAYLNVAQEWSADQKFLADLFGAGGSSSLVFAAADENDGAWLYFSETASYKGMWFDCWGTTNFVISNGDRTGYINFLKPDYLTPMARFSTTSFEIDTIKELTGAAGVTIDGVLLKDNDLSCNDLSCTDVSCFDLHCSNTQRTNTLIEYGGGNGISVESIKFKLGNEYLIDNQKLHFGTSDDISMYWDGTDFRIDALTASTKILLSNNVDEISSAGNLFLSPNNIYIKPGNALYLNIGGIGYMRLYNNYMQVSKPTRYLDNVQCQFGTGIDAVMYYDSTDLIVDTDSVGTGSLKVNGLETRADGTVNFVTLADAAAANSSMYYSSDQSKMVWKDSGGTVNVLY